MFYQQHNIKAKFEEYKVVNHQYGYAGRLDFYGQLDGKWVILDFKTSKSSRWTYGLQLACYRECIEKMGYPVEATYVVHIKPKVRGGVGTAELIEYKYEFKHVKMALELFHLKLAHDPYVKWYERTDEDAIKKELTIKLAQEVTQAAIEPLSAPLTDVQGHQQETQDTSSINEQIRQMLVNGTHVAYLGREGRQVLGTVARASESVEDLPTIHNSSQQEIPAGETSSHRVVIRPGNQSGVIRFASTETPRIVPEPYELPSERDISVDPELEWLDGLNSPPPHHRKIA